MERVIYEYTPVADAYHTPGAVAVSFAERPSFTLTRRAMVHIALKADDEGTLTISGPGGPYTLQATLPEEEWRRKSDPTYWQSHLLRVLEPGTYTLAGSLYNKASGQGSFAYLAVRITEPEPGRPYDDEPRPLCSGSRDCGRSNSVVDDTENFLSELMPRADESGCAGRARLIETQPTRSRAAQDSGESAGTPALALQVQSAWSSRLSIAGSELSISLGTGGELHFSLQAGSAEAYATGSTLNSGYRVQMQQADGSPCDTADDGSNTAPRCLLCAAGGEKLLFDTADGSVIRITAADGSSRSAAEHSAALLCCYAEDGSLQSAYSAQEGLLRVLPQADGSLLAERYAPEAVTLSPDGEVFFEGAPYLSTEYRRSRSAEGCCTTTVTRRSPDLPDQTETLREKDGIIAHTTGSGDTAITRTYRTFTLNDCTQATIESIYYGDAAAGTWDTPYGEQEAAATRTCTLQRKDNGGLITLCRTEGYGSDNERTTDYGYDSESRLIRITHPDGSTTRYSYDGQGRRTTAKTATATGQRIFSTTYLTPAAGARFADTRPAETATYLGGVMVEHTTYQYEESPESRREIRTTTAAGAQQARCSISEYYSETPAYPYAAGKLRFSQAEDGVQTLHEYSATREHGAEHKHTATTYGAGGELVAAASRRSEQYIAGNGTILCENESLWDGSRWLLLNAATHCYDAQQRRIRTRHANGRTRSTAWMCCGKLSETDENGIRTDYAYNAAQQLTEESRSAVYDGDTCITPESITEYERDAAGRLTAVTRRTGPSVSTTRTEYDTLGRTVAETDPLGRRRTTTYSADGRSTTHTAPGGATTTQTSHADGTPATLGGSAQRAVHYSYDTTPGHCRRTTLYTEAGVMLSQSIENGFGQTIAESTPMPAGNLLTTHSEYNERGQLIRRHLSDGTTAQAPTLYEYDAYGRLSRQITAACEAPTPENSAVTDYSYSAESDADGNVYTLTRTTRYNAAGEALTSTEKTLVSALSPILESASIRTDERGNATATRTEYAGGPARLTITEQPGCAAPARSLSIDGFTTEQTDQAGVTTRATRRYTASGTELTQTDGRGNTTTQVTDIAGRILSITDAAGATTTTTYAATSNQPATVTDALGNTVSYCYDERGRKVAEWGTAIQPALYRYDDANRITALTTFRTESSSPTTDPSTRTDGDTTTWLYDEATGLELEKHYADGSAITKTYDSFGNPATETNARGQVTTYTYDPARNLLLTAAYSDGTTTEQYSYNHLGQLTQLTDAAGTRRITYNRYGEPETDELTAGGIAHSITELRDELGRSTGYIYAKNGITQQQTSIGYDTVGRVASAGFLHGGEHQAFTYTYLPGTHLLHTLSHPNGLTLTHTYEQERDLLTELSYTRGSEHALIVRRRYEYDPIGRPTARQVARYGTQTQDTFGYNTRSELISATVDNADYTYAYDAIGNRASATESGVNTAYTANARSQYTAEGSFRPTFDADGNQTLVKTRTGTWSITYNAKNRPTRFVSADGTITVECTYDTMGRRATKKVTTNGTLTEHRSFLYCGYLQIAACDLTRPNTPALWYILWDPTQEIATRPLAIQKNGTWYTYGWDLTKNICETYRTDGRIDLAYAYTPYGEATPAHTYDQPLRWSSEYHDTELGLVYYNYRHYNPTSGRWMGRDFIQNSHNSLNLYWYTHNYPIKSIDHLGMIDYDWISPARDAKRWAFAEVGPTTYYGAGTPETTAIKNSDIGKSLKAFFVNKNRSCKNCKCWKNVTNYAYKFPSFYDIFTILGAAGSPLSHLLVYEDVEKAVIHFYNFWHATLFSARASFVGSCRGDVSIIYVCNNDKQIVKATFKITNTTSFKSLSYGVGPEIPYSHYMGNWEQIYEWSEEFLCNSSAGQP